MFRIQVFSHNSRKQFLPSINKKYPLNLKSLNPQNVGRRKAQTQPRQQSSAQMPQLIKDYYSKYHQTVKKSFEPLSVSINFREVSEKQLENSAKRNKLEKIKKFKQKISPQPSSGEIRKPSFFTPNQNRRQKIQSYKKIPIKQKTNFNYTLEISQCEPSKNSTALPQQLLNNPTEQIRYQQRSTVIRQQELCLQKLQQLKQELKENQKRMRDRRTKRTGAWKINSNKGTKNPEEQKYISPWVMESNDDHHHFSILSKQIQSMQI